jgi:uncharacterized protein YciI
MPNFVVTCLDHPGALEKRQANRPEHLAHLTGRPEVVKLAGPLLDAAGDPCGSLLILQADSAAAARAFAEADPFNAKGVFASIEVRPLRITIGALA